MLKELPDKDKQKTQENICLLARLYIILIQIA